jgi:predicted ATPase
LPDACIYVLTDTDIRRTPYEETEHYILTKQFLNNPQKMLRYLLEEDADGGLP